MKHIQMRLAEADHGRDDCGVAYGYVDDDDDCHDVDHDGDDDDDDDYDKITMVVFLVALCLSTKLVGAIMFAMSVYA